LNKVLDGFRLRQSAEARPAEWTASFPRPITGLTSLTSDASNDNKGSASAPGKPALTDAESKKQTEAASVRERPSPKPPMGDATANNPPKGDKS
jgi:NADH-quinone oxidoreductase subunit E